MADLTAPTGQEAEQHGEVCPRCSNGRPVCTDNKPDGGAYTHDETCANYKWADDVCAECKATADA